jgi:hypothetical protein
MAKARYEYCPACAIRAAVEQDLRQCTKDRLPPGTPHESPTAFWARMEAAELLSWAVQMYDLRVRICARSAHTPRETKKRA